MSNFWFQTRTLIALAVSMLALTEVLDATIVAVALPNLMGSLGATSSQASWIITSYLIASAICMPLTGLMAKKFGRKRMILISTVLFAGFSVMCGFATTLNQMIIFRVLQGIGGGFLPSLAQSEIVENFQGEESKKIMMVYSLCIISGPILGPLLGGVITEHLNWNWIFFINLPICVIGFSLLYFLMRESKVEETKIDYSSFFFLILGVALIQYVLERGNESSWFQSPMITLSLIYGVIALGFFVWRGKLGETVVNFAIFKDSLYIKTCIMMAALFGLAVMVMSYFPTFLQQMYGYTVESAGLISAPRGIASMLAAPIIMKLSTKVESRSMVSIGILILALSTFLLMQLSPETSIGLIYTSIVLQGIGLAMSMIPLTSLAYQTMPKQLSSTATGMFSFFKNIGNSVGTSVAASALSQLQQVNWHHLRQYVSPYSSHFSTWLQQTHFSGQLKTGVALAQQQVVAQSSFLAYLDIYRMALIGLIVLAPLTFFLLKVKDTNTKVSVSGSSEYAET